MLCAVIGTTFATSVAALVLQLKNDHPQQIILGDSITITSKNANSVSKQVQKRIDHTYVPRLANFNATDITVGEANYNLNFNDGSQVY
jgi:3-deoxy-D-manno-octulosonic-acid transferase